MTDRFSFKLERLLRQGRAPLCVGLDPDLDHMPDRYPDPLAWNWAVIAATRDLAACYKPNLAFFEALGSDGYELLGQTLAAIPPEVPVLLDAKRGDIGSTAAAYARACFEVLDADAVTVNPYLGRDGVKPFTAYSDRHVFVLCHTSNPSAAEIQGVSRFGLPLYQYIASVAPSWGEGNVGLVVGATYPEALAEVRALAPLAWLLAPGVGAQGGDAAAALANGLRSDGMGVLVNVARGIALADDPSVAAEMYAGQLRLFARPAVATSPLSYRLRTLASRLYELGCIRFGDFTLASGVQSPVYIDLRLLVSDPSTLALAAQLYAGHVAGLVVNRLAGVPYAGLPIATAVSLETGLPLIYPRKELKTHGRGRSIEGDYTPNERVVVIEDLVTSAGSLIESIHILRSEGLHVNDAVVLIDREQGGEANLAAVGVRLHALMTFTQLLDVLHEAGHIDGGQYQSMHDYLATAAG